MRPTFHCQKSPVTAVPGRVWAAVNRRGWLDGPKISPAMRTADAG
ncbi:MAG TPA: hypothetical protein VFO01_03160 [Trebonia sp.]|nr:hypothetical protein [Trebonia sp.]